MRNDDPVRVQTEEPHHDPRAATDWRHEGERYVAPLELARRRERHGLVEILKTEGEGAEVEVLGPAPDVEIRVIS